MRVLLAGEGKTDLGEWAKEAPHRQPPGEKGVLVALLERIGVAFAPVDAVMWCRIRKYKAGDHASPEARNVLGLGLKALQARCEALVFLRDRDGDAERARDLEDGVRRAHEAFPDLRIAGGIVTETIEGWLLVLLGKDGESFPSKRAKEELERLGVSTLEEKVQVVASASLDALPDGSLHAWIASTRAVLPPG